MLTLDHSKKEFSRYYCGWLACGCKILDQHNRYHSPVELMNVRFFLVNMDQLQNTYCGCTDSVM